MKKQVLIIFFLISNLLSFSQKKNKIYLFDNKGRPINQFEILYYKNNKINVFKNNNSKNIFYIKTRFDSIIINYNLFYSKKVNFRKFKSIDTLYLSEEVSLKKINLNNKINVIGTNGKIYKYGTSVNSEGINRINISKQIGSSIKYVSFFIFDEYKNKFVSKKKLNSSNKKFELYLFQSNNKNPNKEEDIVNLLKSPIIVNIGKINTKDWIKIDLKALDINIKNLKYLFVGYKNLNNYIGIGHSKRKNNINIESFYRNTSAYHWQHLDWYPKGGIYIPAIRIGLRN